MAHVIHSLNVTVSGSCHHADVVADEEHHQYALELLSSAGAVMLGRNTFDLFESFWPQAVHNADVPAHVATFAAELEAKPKWVVSSRDLETNWRNTKLLHGPSLDEVTDLVENHADSIVIFGSPKLGASLEAAGLIREIHVLMQPLIGVALPRAYADLETRRTLSLLEARPFRSGVVLLRYENEA